MCVREGDRERGEREYWSDFFMLLLGRLVIWWFFAFVSNENKVYKVWKYLECEVLRIILLLGDVIKIFWKILNYG